MRTLAAWVRLLAVAAGYAVAFVVVQFVTPFSPTSPWFVFVAMVCFLGLAFVAQPLVMIRMPRPLRAIRPWEVKGELYGALGVRAYGRLLRRTPLRLFNRDVYLHDGLRDTARVAAEMEAAEASHLWSAVLVVPYMVYLVGRGLWTTFAWFLLAQSLINAYPVMHLRLARHRLERITSRRSSRSGGTRSAGPRGARDTDIFVPRGAQSRPEAGSDR
jgi:hypothetical protein